AMNASIEFDKRLLPHDVAGSIAHAEMLAAQGLITSDDARAIIDGLRTVESQLAAGELPWDEALEDVHMNVEARLIEHIGDAGRRVCTAPDPPVAPRRGARAVGQPGARLRADRRGVLLGQ